MSRVGTMLDVTIVLSEDRVTSASLRSSEIFRWADRLWKVQRDHTAEPAFHVRMVTLDGRRVAGSPKSLGPRAVAGVIGGDERVRAVEAFLQDNYPSSRLSIAFLAERSGLGERTFVRRFKAATGKTPAAYVQALRVEAARAMLVRDASSIQAISLAVGYDDIHFFRGLFKRVTQMTPTAYRARFGPPPRRDDRFQGA